MKKVVTTTYIAEDGTVFENEIACRDYEEQHKWCRFGQYMSLFDYKKNPISWNDAQHYDFENVYMVHLKINWEDFPEDRQEDEYALGGILPSSLWELLWEQGWYVKMVDNDEGWVKWNEFKKEVFRYAELIGEG